VHEALCYFTVNDLPQDEEDLLESEISMANGIKKKEGIKEIKNKNKKNESY
jgi:hypothetical protein